MDKPRIIFEDSDLLLVDKPASLVVDRSETQQEHTLEDWLRENYNSKLDRGGIVHRLDKDTSGILLVAKTQQALENLQAQFKERKTKKEYLALVHGLIETKGKVEGNIGRNPQRREKFSVLLEDVIHPSKGGKEAVTEYTPVGNFQFSIFNFQSIFNDLNKIQMRKLERMKYNEFTLLRCFPKTGRTHQIRVHLKYVGHPIVSDETYVGRKMYRLDKRWCPRQFLHAQKLGFFHPVSLEWMDIESPLPEDLQKAFSFLEKK